MEGVFQVVGGSGIGHVCGILTICGFYIRGTFCDGCRADIGIQYFFGGGGMAIQARSRTELDWCAMALSATD